ncbi:melanoma-derived growth regulatory protein isoform X3 [Pteropus medius]|uniref:melanoma-derived growth regulatory protein isoform X3 n=1 Tax=Pteropus vampyrus TaxID=132908 RepID=UPI00196ADA5A|nr:melanoma-derived growth regulatory protein isoform X3 [Pteropus giganteus]
MQTFLLVGAEGLEGERGLPASRKDNYHRWQMKTSRLPHWQSQVLWSADPDPISMAVALQDYVAPDCRFLTIHRGQVVYVFSKLKGRGRLFWGGSVQGDYYGDLAARLGYFPSSIVREDQTLKPGKVDVKTDKWDFYCQ